MEGTRARKRIRLAWDVAPPGREADRIYAAVPAARCASPPWREDDREGHYVFDLGENLTPRYKILSKIGEGTFGRVLECWDREAREYVAIKVVRSIRKYRHAAMIEIDVLNSLSKNDCARCVQIRRWFDYRNHICIVCEKLGPSLYDFLKRNKYCPFPVELIREFGRQLLEAVACVFNILYLFIYINLSILNRLKKFLWSYFRCQLSGLTYILYIYIFCKIDMHDLRLIHTDLKPENILLVSSEYIKVPTCKRNSQEEIQFRVLPKSSAIKLIDFGSTAFENHDHNSIVSTRHYRAPEIILGLGWHYPCDMWSIGCILVELCTGEALFQTHENLEHLAMMEKVLGPMPEHMIRVANCAASKYFKHGAWLNWPEGAVSRESIRAVRKLDRLKDLVCRHVEYSRASMMDLLYGLLKFEPTDRLTAGEALNHPFFKNPT